MDRTTLITIIKDYQEKIKQEHILYRSLNIPKNIEKKACTIIGPRRSGKTFYLFQIGQKKIQTSGLQSILYINFEDDRLFPISNSELELILSVYFELYPEQKDKNPSFLFDEIQNVEGWDRFVRRVIDTENVELYLTGSSSKLLSKEIATSIRGRTLTFELFPYNPEEFLVNKKYPVDILPNCSSKQLARIKKLLTEYLHFGGFPELLSYENAIKEKILRDYVELMVYRDIIERHNLRNIKSVKVFLKLVITSLSKEFSIHKVYNFYRSQQLKISKNSLYEYLEYLHDALVVFPLRKFSKSIKQQEQTIPKIYLADTGYLVPYIVGSSEYLGRLLENCVFMNFRRQGYEENKNLFYFVTKNGYEIDFLLFNKFLPYKMVQCCYDISANNTNVREVRALKEASKELNCIKLYIITWDYEKEIDGDGIQYIPFWKFVAE